MAEQKSARVTAPYATVTIVDETGVETVRGFYAGALLPSSAKPEAVESLVDRGYAEWHDGPTLEEQAADDREAEQKARENAKKVAEEVAAEEERKAAEKAEKKAAAAKPVETETAEYDVLPPPASASKADWVAYAVSQRAEGVSEEGARAEAESYSKNDLINMYGG